MKVLVTGAGGFIGCAVTEQLVREGHDVIAVSRHAGPLPGLHDGRGRIRVIVADVLDLDLADLVSGVDAVVHLSGRGNIRASWADCRSYVRDNVEVTGELSRNAANQVKVFLLASSSSVYAGKAPWPESADLGPVSPYGATKLAAEQIARTYFSGSCAQLIIARLFSVYGPGQRRDLVLSRLIDCAIAGESLRLHGDGRQRHDFTFVGDVADCLTRLLSSGEHGVFNICTGVSHSLLDLIAIVSELIGKPVIATPDGLYDPQTQGPAEFLGDNGKLIRACGFRHWTPLRVGVAKQLEWHRANV